MLTLKFRATKKLNNMILLRKLLGVILGCFITSFAYSQSEVLKDVVNNLAYFNEQKDLKYLAEAKKAVDKSIQTRSDSSNLTKNVYKTVVYASIAYQDSLNTLKLPANFQESVNDLITKVSTNSKKFKFDTEIAYAKRCLSNSYIRSAFVELKKYDFAAGLALFKKAQVLTPNVPALNVYMAYTYEKLGKLRDAVKYYDDLIKSDIKLEYVQTAVNLYKTLGDTTQALNMIKKGREVYPKNKTLLFEEANIYNNKKDYVALRKLLNELVTAEPNDADIMFLTASCYDYLNEYEEAESFYLKAIEINGNNYDPIYNLGILYLKMAELNKGSGGTEENLNRSKQWLEKAHEIAPNDINGLKVLKVLYAETGNNDQLDKVNNQLKQLTNY